MENEKRQKLFNDLQINETNRDFFAKLLDAFDRKVSKTMLAPSFVAAAIATQSRPPEIIEIFKTLTANERKIITGEFVGEIPVSETKTK